MLQRTIPVSRSTARRLGLNSCRPQARARRGIERDHAGVFSRILAADVGDDAPVLDERRACSTEEPLADAEAARGVHAPDALPVREIERVQLAFGAERIDAALH